MLPSFFVAAYALDGGPSLIGLAGGLFHMLFASLLWVQTKRVRCVMEKDGFEFYNIKGPKLDLENGAYLEKKPDNYVSGTRNRWTYDSIINYGFFPSLDYPVICYFKETETPEVSGPFALRENVIPCFHIHSHIHSCAHANRNNGTSGLLPLIAMVVDNLTSSLVSAMLVNSRKRWKSVVLKGRIFQPLSTRTKKEETTATPTQQQQLLKRRIHSVPCSVRRQESNAI